LKQPNKWFTLSLLLIAPLLTIVDVYIINMAVPAIKNQFQTVDSMTELVINAYLVGYCVFLITGSRIGDFYGRKKAFLLGMLSFTLSSAFCGWANTIEQLIIFRFLQGIAAALMVPQTLTIMQLNFTQAKERNIAFGLLGIAMGIASIIGQYLGGYFIGKAFIAESWRLIFLINIPLGAITLVLSLLYLKESKSDVKGKFDISGVALLTLALGILVYNLSIIPEQGLHMPIIVSLVISIVLFYFFFKNQSQKTLENLNPLLNTALFKVKSFNFVLLIVLFFFGAHNTFFMMSSIHWQQTLGLNALAASHYYSFTGIGFLIASFVVLRKLTHYGINLLLFGCFLMITSIALQLFLLTDKSNTPSIPYLLLLYGLGQGMVLPSILNFALRKIPTQYAALATGVYSTVQQFSSAFGLSIIGSIYFYSEHQGWQAYKIGMACILLYLIAVILLLYRLSIFTNVGNLNLKNNDKV
jgi:EmrB/QacA subfamily drug resistance transporter